MLSRLKERQPDSSILFHQAALNQDKKDNHSEHYHYTYCKRLPHCPDTEIEHFCNLLYNQH